MAEEEAFDLPSPEACVICLERLTERAIALPCKHDQFHFSCLGTWLNQQRVCPLCKSAVAAIKYNLETSPAGTLFTLAPPETEPHKESRYRHHHPYQGRHDRLRGLADASTPSFTRTRVPQSRRIPQHIAPSDSALAFRHRVYQEQLFSLRVGNNQISRYRNLTPTSFTTNPSLITRAKTWIRRELSAFDFLNPDSPAYGRADRRASNAEFLLEYIVAILKSIDLRGSSGQAEELLVDFLGRGSARLFLHELEAFLRSPFERIKDWDRAVQYAENVAERKVLTGRGGIEDASVS